MHDTRINMRAAPCGSPVRPRPSIRTLGLAAITSLAACLTAPAGAAIDLGALAEDPCLIAPKPLIADTFDVPVDAVEQTGTKVMGRMACNNEWSVEDRNGHADVTVQIFNNPAGAKAHFDNVTRSVSAEEMAADVELMKDKDAKPGSSEDLANQLLSKVAGGAITFEDVDGVGDAARFDTSHSTLTARQGNLIMSVEAYDGPPMPLPDTLNAQTMTKAGKQWHQDTREERKQAASALASAIVEHLQ